MLIMNIVCKSKYYEITFKNYICYIGIYRTKDSRVTQGRGWQSKFEYWMKCEYWMRCMNEEPVVSNNYENEEEW